MTRQEIIQEQLNQLCTYELVDIIIRIDKGEDKEEVLKEYLINI